MSANTSLPTRAAWRPYLRDLMVCSLKTGHALSGSRSQRATHLAFDRRKLFSGGKYTLRYAGGVLAQSAFYTHQSKFPVDIPATIDRWRPKILHLHLPNPSSFWALLLPSARRLPWVVRWQSDALTPDSGRLIQWCYLLLISPLSQRCCGTRRKSSSRLTVTSIRAQR